MKFCTLNKQDLIDRNLKCEFEIEEISDRNFDKLQSAHLTYEEKRNRKQPENKDDFFEIDKIDTRLKGSMRHSRTMALLQYHIYDDLDHSIVERKSFDLVDFENKVMAEVGQVKGKQSKFWIEDMFNVRVFRFLTSHGLGNLRDWKFYCLTYNTSQVIKAIPTEEVYEAIESNIIE